ncbi:hypothetical protein GALL_187800 [mine drainage metagenome]|uniref:Uncharacterized protein n=1 Tax=mine drainage metagenome TaxID=410659 RepID=A0A1J5RTA0_9ZZZZ
MTAIDGRRQVSSSATQSRENAGLLGHSRDRVAARLRLALRGALSGVCADLLRRGELVDEQRHLLYGIRDALLEQGVQLESLLAGHWRREFDAAAAGRSAVRLSVLSLDEPGDREEEFALQAIAERLRGRCGPAVEAIGRRLVVLSGREQAGGAAPEVLCKALRATLCDAALGRLERLELLRCLLPYAGTEFAAVYEDWRDALASAVPLGDASPARVVSSDTDHAAAEAALAGFLVLPLPSVAAQLLAGEWRELLTRIHAEGDRAAWNAANAVAGELVWSVRIAPGSPERKTLVGRLPNLLKQLHDGFERIGVDAGRRVEILDGLFGVHAAILRGDPPAIPVSRAALGKEP